MEPTFAKELVCGSKFLVKVRQRDLQNGVGGQAALDRTAATEVFKALQFTQHLAAAGDHRDLFNEIADLQLAHTVVSGKQSRSAAAPGRRGGSGDRGRGGTRAGARGRAANGRGRGGTRAGASGRAATGRAATGGEGLDVQGSVMELERWRDAMPEHAPARAPPTAASMAAEIPIP